MSFFNKLKQKIDKNLEKQGGIDGLIKTTIDGAKSLKEQTITQAQKASKQTQEYISEIQQNINPEDSTLDKIKSAGSKIGIDLHSLILDDEKKDKPTETQHKNKQLDGELFTFYNRLKSNKDFINEISSNLEGEKSWYTFNIKNIGIPHSFIIYNDNKWILSYKKGFEHTTVKGDDLKSLTKAFDTLIQTAQQELLNNAKSEQDAKTSDQSEESKQFNDSYSDIQVNDYASIKTFKKPVVKKPAAKKPAVKTTGGASTTKTPAAKTTGGASNIKTPAAKKPAVKTTGGAKNAKTPAIKTTGGTKTANTPTAKKPAVKTTGGAKNAKAPAVKTTSGTKTANTSAAKKPAVKTTGGTKNAKTPAVKTSPLNKSTHVKNKVDLE